MLNPREYTIINASTTTIEIRIRVVRLITNMKANERYEFDCGHDRKCEYKWESKYEFVFEFDSQKLISLGNLFFCGALPRLDFFVSALGQKVWKPNRSSKRLVDRLSRYVGQQTARQIT